MMNASYRQEENVNFGKQMREMLVECVDIEPVRGNIIIVSMPPMAPYLFW